MLKMELKFQKTREVTLKRQQSHQNEITDLCTNTLHINILLKDKQIANYPCPTDPPYTLVPQLWSELTGHHIYSSCASIKQVQTFCSHSLNNTMS